jgi:putative transposase
MANTFTQVYIHLVFAVKNREKLIADTWKKELYDYISGIIHRQGQRLLIINGIADHVHLLISLRPNISISELVRDIKANSSRFIREKNFVSNFQWQNGYGVFSIAHSGISKVSEYIRNQENHHRNLPFREEFQILLKENDLTYLPEYLP